MMQVRINIAIDTSEQMPQQVWLYLCLVSTFLERVGEHPQFSIRSIPVYIHV